MLKIKDKEGKTVMVLKDDANEPDVVVDVVKEEPEKVETKEEEEGEENADV